ncbi:unnamed protein product, partial [marine sediment metagenome]
ERTLMAVMKSETFSHIMAPAWVIAVLRIL